MKDIKNKYEQVTLQRKSVITQINALKEEKTVKDYLELLDQNEELARLQTLLYEQMKKEEYSSCNHVWITTFARIDCEGRTECYHTCLKCGLDENVFRIEPTSRKVSLLGSEQKRMWNYMRLNSYKNGIYNEERCDIDLARNMYQKIKEKYPDFDDVTILDYLDDAIRNMRKSQKQEFDVLAVPSSKPFVMAHEKDSVQKQQQLVKKPRNNK